MTTAGRHRSAGRHADHAVGTATTDPDLTGNGVDQLPADLQDERLIASHGVSGAISAFTARLRSGDLGSVPVVLGLIIIWAVFQIANSSFLSSRNLVNLTLQTTLGRGDCPRHRPGPAAGRDRPVGRLGQRPGRRRHRASRSSTRAGLWCCRWWSASPSAW